MAGEKNAQSDVYVSLGKAHLAAALSTAGLAAKDPENSDFTPTEILSARAKVPDKKPAKRPVNSDQKDDQILSEDALDSARNRELAKAAPPMGWNAAFVLSSKGFWDSLFRFAMSLTHDEASSEDLVQVTLMKGLQSFERFVGNEIPGVLEPVEATRAFERQENAAHLKNWLYRILKNTFLDENVKKKRARFEVSSGENSGLENTPTSHVEQMSFLPNSLREATSEELKNFDEEFAGMALDDDWRQRFEDLTSRQRSVLFLSAEGYAYKEIATILGVPMGTVMSNLSRALQKLKRSVGS